MSYLVLVDYYRMPTIEHGSCGMVFKIEAQGSLWAWIDRTWMSNDKYTHTMFFKSDTTSNLVTYCVQLDVAYLRYNLK